ncbi:type II secretion system F family protein [Streptomyces sp. NPDC101150]|uniref:type II secretion system F family protein n=1 Tax=Streptomyces sp. NPDC101150 TaxID=3366114 RepID=UPI00381A5543
MSLGQLGMLGALCGLLMVGGIILFVRSFSPPAQAGRVRPKRASLWQRICESLPGAWAERYRWIVVASGVMAVGVWVWTARPMQGLLAAAVVAGFPWIWHPSVTSTRRIVRLEALSRWLQHLAGAHVVGHTLEAAISGAMRQVPADIHDPVRTLEARLRMGVDPEAAYRAFADDFDDGAVDNVVLVFITHIRDRGRGMVETLQTLSDLTAEEAASLRTVDADRQKVRTQTRWVAIIVLAMGFTMGSSFGPAYNSAGGQMWLLLMGAAFVGAMVWLRRLCAVKPSPRLLQPRPALESKQAAMAGPGGVG